MKKTILIGRSNVGKTTLIRAIEGLNLECTKTQAINYQDNFIDTPGEYIENRRFYSSLISLASNCDLIGLVQDSTESDSMFPPKFANMFNQPTIGIITKIDLENKNIQQAKNYLRTAGADRIFLVSSFSKEGIKKLKKFLA